jgi:plastocyanin
MLRRTLALLALAAAALAVAAVSSASSAKTRFDLKGEVYANFKIEMKKASGVKVRTLKAKTYVIKVEDHSSIHNFHLIGPGVNKKTSVGGVGERLWTVRLRPGTYRFLCDPHASTMRGTFRVVA